MTDTEIRPERAGDEDRIRAVTDAAFGDTATSAIIDGIRGTDRWIEGGSRVADAGGEIVGHVLLSEGDLVADDGGARRIWMVGPVSVVPEWQGRGVGSALMRAAIDEAAGRNQQVLCLLGHATYYPRFGFEPARVLGIEPPRPWPDANWMARRLAAWDGTLKGVAHFPPAFPED